jgi:hypothetical protein
MDINFKKYFEVKFHKNSLTKFLKLKYSRSKILNYTLIILMVDKFLVLQSWKL